MISGLLSGIMETEGRCLFFRGNAFPQQRRNRKGNAERGSQVEIRIQNFGPIREFTYDLSKKLIITYGKNNIGKSYSMQAVYLLIKSFLSAAKGYSPAMVLSGGYSGYTGNRLAGQKDFNSMARLKQKLESVYQYASDGEESFDASALVTEECGRLFADEILPLFLNSCKNTFGNFKGLLKSEPEITVSLADCELTIHLKQETITWIPNVTVQAPIRPWEQTSEDAAALLYSRASGMLSDLLRLLNEEISAVYFLPASRSGIYSTMSSFGAIVAELSKNRAFLTKNIELPGISEPVSDYFIALSGIRMKEGTKYRKEVRRIEEEILDGSVLFDEDRSVLLYRPNQTEGEFGMAEVSSMVSEVSPIAAFLKYIVEEDAGNANANLRAVPLLFIEEPEAHLHPENQVRLTGILAGLAQSDLKIAVSSHSNYIFNKMNNLVLKGECSGELYAPILLVKEEGGSVSHRLAMDELGAEDENFMDVSEALYEEREDIIREMTRED